MHDLQMYVGNDKLTLSEAMQRIDKNSTGIIFITDSENKLVGCITDGDIRRFLLQGGQMSALAINAANRQPCYANTIDEAKKKYRNGGYVLIPIVNENNLIVDLYGEKEIVGNERKYASLNLPVVINAGGRGTRLDPYTRVLPKPLIPIGDLPIIEHIMKEYQKYSCEDFHIILNYKRDLVKAYFSESMNHYNISWYDEKKPLGTGGGLKLLKGIFHDTFFFANCDALLTANYESIKDFHKNNGNVITMVCTYNNIHIPYGTVEIGKDGVIERMREKPLISFLANTGIYMVEPEVIDDIEDDEVIGFPDIIEREREKGRKVAVFPVGESEWMDMGQLPELEKMRIKICGE